MKKIKILMILGLAMLVVLPFTSHSANADSLIWRVQSKYAYQVNLEFYSKSRNHAWPGGTKVYVLKDSKTHRFSLSCNYNEKICYGAWVRGNRDRYWGVGRGGSHSCKGCCYRCTGGTTPIRILRR